MAHLTIATSFGPAALTFSSEKLWVIDYRPDPETPPIRIHRIDYTDAVAWMKCSAAVERLLVDHFRVRRSNGEGPTAAAYSAFYEETQRLAAQLLGSHSVRSAARRALLSEQLHAARREQADLAEKLTEAEGRTARLASLLAQSDSVPSPPLPDWATPCQ